MLFLHFVMRVCQVCISNLSIPLTQNVVKVDFYTYFCGAKDKCRSAINHLVWRVVYWSIGL